MKKLAFLTYSHFTVDFACFTVLFGLLRHTLGVSGSLSLSFLAYNLLAFGLQAPLGAFIDVKGLRREGFAALGAAVTVLGLAAGYLIWALALSPALGVAAMVVSAVGNAAFHVGAGSAVLCDCGGRILPAGIFNCAGALGVGLGTYLGTVRPAVSFPLSLAAIILACALIIRLCRRPRNDGEGCRSLARLTGEPDLGVLAAALFASIAVHTCAGGLVPSVPALTGALTMTPAVMICLGKLSGGALADKLGGRNTVIFPLLLSGALFALSGVLPALALPAILLMNMSVSVTLCAMAGAMPESPGFAFGFTKLAIALGSAASFFLPLSDAARGPAVGALTALSALAALTLRNKKEEKEYVHTHTP